jgi:hypothetical protein
MQTKLFRKTAADLLRMVIRRDAREKGFPGTKRRRIYRMACEYAAEASENCSNPAEYRMWGLVETYLHDAWTKACIHANRDTVTVLAFAFEDRIERIRFKNADAARNAAKFRYGSEVRQIWIEHTVAVPFVQCERIPQDCSARMLRRG